MGAVARSPAEARLTRGRCRFCLFHCDLAGHVSGSTLLRVDGDSGGETRGFLCHHGRALPSLAQADPEPTLWISPADAAARALSDGGSIRIVNDRGAMTARAHVTDRVPAGTVWMRDGWLGINELAGGAPAIPDAAVQALLPLGFSGGQATFDARVEVEAV